MNYPEDLKTKFILNKRQLKILKLNSAESHVETKIQNFPYKVKHHH